MPFKIFWRFEMLESDFKKGFFVNLRTMLHTHGLVPTILAIDPTNHRSHPDHMVIVGEKWALLEFKKSKDAKHQPNQEYYIQLFNEKSYASFVYPENEEEVLRELEELFTS